MPQTCLLAEASLRRNYADLSFCPQDRAEDLEKSKRRSLSRLQQVRGGFGILEGGKGQGDRTAFLEEAMLPPAIGSLTSAALAGNLEEKLFAAVNVEEHLLLKACGRPEEDAELVSRVRALERDLADERHPFAQDSRFDYLSYRPVLAGSGLHLTLVLHLPMLSFLRQIPKLSDALLREERCVLKPLTAPEARNPGRIFLLSNASSQGLGDEEILSMVRRCGGKLDEKETVLRGKALDGSGESSMSDQVWRSYGILRHARRLSVHDFLSHWSNMRLGAAAGVLPLSLRQADDLLDCAPDSAFSRDGLEIRTIPYRRADRVRQAISGG